MRAEDVGRPSTTLVLGKHSGRHALKARCESLGIELSRLELDELYRRMIKRTEARKVIGDTDLREMTTEMRVTEARQKAAAKRSATWEPTPLLDEAGYGFGV